MKKSTLHLNLHRKWFDMILSGEKKEEYREIKKFYNRKFLTSDCFYNTITFSNGYAKNRKQFVIELKSIKTGLGIEIWGAPLRQKVFILELGQIIRKNEHC